jgi:hypothetical protein
MDDWSEACDPVPAKRELTEAQKRRLKALVESRRRDGLRIGLETGAAYRVDPAFDEVEG